MPLSIEEFLNNAQFFGDSGAGEQLIDMQSVHTFEMVLKLTNVLTLARFPWQASESVVLQFSLDSSQEDQCPPHGVAFMMSAMSCPSLSVPDQNSF